MANNGDTLRKLLAQYAGLLDPALARRIENDIALPNSMVDRIVPAATPESLAWAAQRLGLRDEAAIVCEPFTQWVIEDRFAGPRPAWEDAGALLTERRAPLSGDEAAPAQRHAFGDRLCRPAVRARKRLRRDGRPRRRLVRTRCDGTTCAPPWPCRPGYDVERYCEQLLRRFENPALAHRTQQIAMDGTQKVPVRWLPALRESAAAGVERPHLERALAAWLHYLMTERSDNGQGAHRQRPRRSRRSPRACAVPPMPSTPFSKRSAMPACSVTCRGRRRLPRGWPDTSRRCSSSGTAALLRSR